MADHQVIINSQIYKLIPLGLCKCGCGEKTTIPDRNNNFHGYKKGVPQKYKRGHNQRYIKCNVFKSGALNKSWKGGRIRSGEYMRIKCDGHPRADKKGYVLEHIIICEQILGRYLPKGVMVHHINGIKHDNRHENLILCQDQSYHSLLHLRERALRESGDVHSRQCKYCRLWDSLDNLVINRSHPYHRECHKINHRAYWRKHYSKDAKALSVRTGI